MAIGLQGGGESRPPKQEQPTQDDGNKNALAALRESRPAAWLAGVAVVGSAVVAFQLGRGAAQPEGTTITTTVENPDGTVERNEIFVPEQATQQSTPEVEVTDEPSMAETVDPEYQSFLESVPAPQDPTDPQSIISSIYRTVDFAYCTPELEKDARYLDFAYAEEHTTGYGDVMEYINDPTAELDCRISKVTEVEITDSDADSLEDATEFNATYTYRIGDGEPEQLNGLFIKRETDLGERWLVHTAHATS